MPDGKAGNAGKNLQQVEAVDEQQCDAGDVRERERNAFALRVDDDGDAMLYMQPVPHHILANTKTS